MTYETALSIWEIVHNVLLGLAALCITIATIRMLFIYISSKKAEKERFIREVAEFRERMEAFIERTESQKCNEDTDSNKDTLTHLEEYRQKLKTEYFKNEKEAKRFVIALEERERFGLPTKPLIDHLIARKAGLNTDTKYLNQILEALTHTVISPIKKRKPVSSRKKKATERENKITSPKAEKKDSVIRQTDITMVGLTEDGMKINLGSGKYLYNKNVGRLPDDFED